MVHDLIKRLIEIIKEEDVDEIEVRRFWTKVRVARRRHASGSSSTGTGLPDAGGASRSTGTEGMISSARAGVGVDEGPPVASETLSPHPASNHKEIVSPMVGTFYSARDPRSEPFVYEGKTVEVGDVLCIIEAMKLMNEIESDTKGVIRKILVEDSQPVEFGQPLFLVESA